MMPGIVLLRLRKARFVKQRIRVEITSKHGFWERAFHVEWEHQFPDRTLNPDGLGRFFAQSEWLDDLERVGGKTFCTVRQAPENPTRREWFGSLIPRRQ